MTGIRQHHHLRHGRHVLRRGADQGRRADLRQPRQDRRPRPRRADDGHQHGERRRRHDRQSRPLRRARSRPAKRRRGAGSGLLRPRRRSGRRSPTAICCLAISAPTIFSAAACGSTAPRPTRRSRAWQSRCRSMRVGGGRRHRAHHRREDGGSHQGDLHHARP